MKAIHAMYLLSSYGGQRPEGRATTTMAGTDPTAF